MKRSPVQFVDEEEETTQKEDPVEESKKVHGSTPKNDESSDLIYSQVSIPSNGRLGYPGTIEYRDVVFGDEIKIKMATQDTWVRTVNKVLKGILNNPPFYDDMCIFDRDFLLLWVFANSYSPKDKMTMNCTHCGHSEEFTIDLTEFDVNDIDPEIPVPFKMDLKTGDKIEVHLPRVRDELVAESMAKGDSNVDFDDYMLQSTIDVKTQTFKNNEKKFEWISENISAKEMSVVKKFHDRFSFGVNDIIERQCKNCGEVNRGRYPFRLENFFLHSGSDDDFEYYLQLNKVDESS